MIAAPETIVLCEGPVAQRLQEILDASGALRILKAVAT